MSLFSDITHSVVSQVSNDLCGESVVLKRDDQEVTVAAVPAESQYTVESVDAVRMRVSVRDWIIEAEDYDFGDGPVDPQLGDTITETLDNSTERVWEVGPLPGDNHAWRWSDRRAKRIRVHCHEVT